MRHLADGHFLPIDGRFLPVDGKLPPRKEV